MKLNPGWSACLIAAACLVGLGLTGCDPFIDPACDPGEIECPDGTCVPEGEECPPLEECPEGYIECPDGTCVPEGEECPTGECPADTPIRCDDEEGTCVAYEWECCRLAGTCDPNRYDQASLGPQDTSAYRDRLMSDFDVRNSNGDILSVNAWAEGDAVRYWLLQDVDSNAIAVDMFPDGARVNRMYDVVNEDLQYVQDPVLEHLPSDTQYSSLVQIWLVHVPDGYTPDAMKSVSAIENAADDAETGVWLEPTDSVRVVEVTDQSVGLHRIGDIDVNRQPLQIPVWKDGYEAHAWLDFITPAADEVSLGVAINDESLVTPPDPLPASLFQPLDCHGRNIFEEKNLPGRTLYQPLTIRMYIEFDGGDHITGNDCDDTPTSADALLADINSDDSTYQFSEHADMLLMTPQFPQ